MRFRVLGAVEAIAPEGRVVPLSDRQRALLASLLARAGEVVSVDALSELVWGPLPPADPAAALHNQISRLRRAIPFARLVTRPPGYTLEPDGLDVDLDAWRFAALARQGRHEEALALWRGPAYAEFADTPVARFAAIHLEEARLAVLEQFHTERIGVADALPGLEALVAEHPLREGLRAVQLKSLYALGRHADALASYEDYSHRLADELGLEPSIGLRDLRLMILRQEVPADHSLAGAVPASVYTKDGRGIGVARLGAGPALVALPSWISSIDVVAAGRDPRSSVLQRLTGRVRLTLYDRYGTGRSPGDVTDFGLDASVRELEAVVEAGGERASLLAMSQSGPVAVALAARRPDLVHRLVFFGTYAAGPDVFTRRELNANLVAMVRTHWGLGSKLFADLYRPHATDAAAAHLAGVLRDSAEPEVAARYLEAIYDIDVTGLLAAVAAPALVIHYRGDRVVPFAGGAQLAARLPDAHFLPLDGRFHLPDARDLDSVVAAITTFLHEGR